MTFNDPYKKPFESILGKEENAGNQHFLLFPKCFQKVFCKGCTSTFFFSQNVFNPFKEKFPNLCKKLASHLHMLSI